MASDQHVGTGADRFAVGGTSEHFAWIRTRLALENTLMAWVRTSISLIGFGFAVVEIFNRLAAAPNVASAFRPEMPRYVGLALIGAGVLGGAVSCWHYICIDNYLWRPLRRI